MQNNSFTAIPSLDNKEETKRFLLTLLMKIDELYGNRGDDPVVTSKEAKNLLGVIQNNTSNISANRNDISANRNDINTNASNISTNASNISTNASNISTNASNIDSIINQDITLDGVKTFNKVFKVSTETSISAYSGGGQANATQLTSYLNNITTCNTDHDSVKLLNAEAGLIQVVINNGAKILDIYPNTDDSINNQNANTSISLASGSKIQLVCVDSSNWYSL